MTADPQFLEISFESAGIRNSLKRLKDLIEELAVEPLKNHHQDLGGNFEAIEEIILKRVANVITYWCINKHDPVKPTSKALMSDITNARRDNTTLEQFYMDQAKNALHILSPILAFGMPEDYESTTDELEYALLELEEQVEQDNTIEVRVSSEQLPTPKTTYENSTYEDIMAGIDLDEWGGEDDDYSDYDDYYDYDEDEDTEKLNEKDTVVTFVTKSPESRTPKHEVKTPELRTQPNPQNGKSIVVTTENNIQEVQQQIHITTLNVASEDAWGMIYNLMGYPSEYIQTKMLPRWQQYPEQFEKDRRYLYEMFIKTIQNASGTQVIAGNYTFADGRMTIDQLWNYYFSDLSQNIAPQLAAARFDNAVNETRFQKMFRPMLNNLRNISPIWMIALVIALVFDGLTTYVSLDQTPMDGFMVMVFTVLITALFQIADVLVINYRQREFEADAMIAKYRAKFHQLSKTIESLETTSESYVQFSMERSQAQTDLNSAQDNRQMARRGRFWSARIADINVIVTAYGFAFMFLNAEEPMQALAQQIHYIFVDQSFENVNVWVFLMVSLAITVSFVINTAQRTEILGWTMRRLKTEA